MMLFTALMTDSGHRGRTGLSHGNNKQDNKGGADAPSDCARCGKPPALCFCSSIQPVKTQLHVLILQHPQEPDKELGSARIANLSLANSTLKVGLSWSNLTKALGRPAQHGQWGVLFLGGRSQARQPSAKPSSPLQIMTKLGRSFDPSEVELEGIVVLDGTWSQAKTMWWRNPWLLKLKRLVLTPTTRSMYGNLRKEPRRECLSTIESIAETLDALGDNPEASETLRRNFNELLKRWKKANLLKVHHGAG